MTTTKTLAQRLKAAMDTAPGGGMNANQLAIATGLTRGAISLLLSGATKSYRGDTATKIAQALGCRVEYLVDGSGPMRQSVVKAVHPDDEPDPDTVLIKESRISFSGGPGRKASMEIVEDSEPASYRLSWFQKEKIKPERCGRFRIVGHSQEPFLFPDDTILVNFDETKVVNDKIYALRYGDDLRVKRIRKTLTGLTLISWNDREYPPEHIQADEVNDLITIIGRVRDKSGRGGL